MKKVKDVKIDYTKLIPEKENVDEGEVDYNSIRQLLSRAIFEGRPLVIVEGRDDVTVYQYLARTVKKEFNIRPIETIKGYGEGCDHVKKFIGNAQVVIDETVNNDKFLLGIIDRDASAFRGEDYSHLKCLLILEAYSYESHYTTENHVRYVTEQLVHNIDLINDDVLKFIMSDLENQYSELYYLSLEALKKACVREYTAVLGYSMPFGQIKQHKTQILTDIFVKKADLDEFAEIKMIQKSDIKRIAKGKWLIDTFIDSIYGKIQQLHNHCVNNSLNVLSQCPYCQTGKNEKCDWKVKKHCSKDVAKFFIYQFIDVNETKYIADRFKLLA